MHVSAEKVNTEEPSMKKLRKFEDSYIKYDIMEYSDGRTQYTLCLIILSVEALKLNRHVTTIHPEHANRSKDFFLEKERRIRQANGTTD